MLEEDHDGTWGHFRLIECPVSPDAAFEEQYYLIGIRNNIQIEPEIVLLPDSHVVTDNLDG